MTSKVVFWDGDGQPAESKIQNLRPRSTNRLEPSTMQEGRRETLSGEADEKAESTLTLAKVLAFASRLAASLFDDEEIGKEIAAEALSRQQSTIDARVNNRKRRNSSDPNRVLPNAVQVLQTLVFRTSRLIEIAQEEIQLGRTGPGVDEADQFDLGHLVQMAARLPVTAELLTRRYLASQMWNGFFETSQHLAVRSCCLLRPFSVKECASIYDLLAPPDPIAEKFAYRLRDKGRDQFIRRFAHFRAAEIFDFSKVASSDNSTAEQLRRMLSQIRLANNEPYSDLIHRNIITQDGLPVALETELAAKIRKTKDYLSELVPWGSPCIAPKVRNDARGFSGEFGNLIEQPTKSTLAHNLQFPTRNDRNEMFRTHALICPNCYGCMVIEIFTLTRETSWLALSLGFAIPAFIEVSH